MPTVVNDGKASLEIISNTVSWGTKGASLSNVVDGLTVGNQRNASQTISRNVVVVNASSTS